MCGVWMCNRRWSVWDFVCAAAKNAEAHGKRLSAKRRGLFLQRAALLWLSCPRTVVQMHCGAVTPPLISFNVLTSLFVSVHRNNNLIHLILHFPTSVSRVKCRKKKKETRSHTRATWLFHYPKVKATAFGYTQQRTAVKRTLTATKLANHGSSNPPGKNK